MLKCSPLLATIVMVVSHIEVEAAAVPVAEPDPRDYALVPMDYLLEEKMKNTPTFLSTADELQADEVNLHPGFRAADPRPQPFIGPILAGTKGVLMAVPWSSVAGYGAVGAGMWYTHERAMERAVNSARTIMAGGEGQRPTSRPTQAVNSGRTTVAGDEPPRPTSRPTQAVNSARTIVAGAIEDLERAKTIMAGSEPPRPTSRPTQAVNSARTTVAGDEPPRPTSRPTQVVNSARTIVTGDEPPRPTSRPTQG